MVAWALLAFGSSGSASTPGATTSALAALVQDKQAQANFAVMQALTEEAKKLLAQELERAKLPGAMAQPVEPEPLQQGKEAEKPANDAKPPAKKARVDKTYDKEAQAETPTAKGVGSVMRYLNKPEAAGEPEQVADPDAKPEDRPTSYVMPKPKHRPVRWVQTIAVDGGQLEIFTRMKPNSKTDMSSQTEESYLASCLPSSSSKADSIKKDVEAKKPPPPPPPLPPPAPQLPPLPPPTTPHPEVIQKVAKQMLELKETFEARSKETFDQ